MRERVSEAERLQLIGLLTLAQYHNARLEDLKAATLRLLDIADGDRDQAGMSAAADHAGDAVYGSRQPDELLRLLGITVEGR